MVKVEEVLLALLGVVEFENGRAPGSAMTSQPWMVCMERDSSRSRMAAKSRSTWLTQM